MADVLIVHPGHGGTAVVSQEAFDHHHRQAGWMTQEELDEHRARVAETEQAASKAPKKTATAGKE
jgi:hypothetical protein